MKTKWIVVSAMGVALAGLLFWFVTRDAAGTDAPGTAREIPSPEPTMPVATPPTSALAFPAKETLRAGDLLTVTFEDVVEPGSEVVRTVRLNSDGRYPVPTLAPVRIEGLSVAEAEAAMSKALGGKPVSIVMKRD